MPLYKTEALVIRRRPLGEADHILTLLTPDHGKLDAVAKGSRKPAAGLTGKVELFTHLRALLATGRSLDVVSQVEVIHPHAAMRGDLVRYAYGSYLLELFDLALDHRAPHPGVFRLLRAALEALERAPAAEHLVRYVEMRFLQQLGYAPQVGFCVHCRKSAAHWRYSPRLGGLLCDACRTQDPEAAALSASAVEALQALAGAPSSAVARRPLAPPLAREVEMILRRHLEYRLDRRLRSSGSMADLAGAGGAAR